MNLNKYEEFENVFEANHPLIKHKLSLMRDESNSKKKFKELAYETTVMLAYELSADLPLTTKRIKTPLEEFDTPVIAGKKPVLLPILRAGLGMVDGFLSLMPGARVGHIGLYRDEETLEPHSYYFKMPVHSAERPVYVLDPMLATGGSASDAITKVKEIGVKKIKFACLVAAPEGIRKLATAHPDITIYCANIDRELNDKGYILPGLGDAGDRLFGTK